MIDQNTRDRASERMSPRIELVEEKISVVISGKEVARSFSGKRIVGIEPAPIYFVPPSDIDMDALFPSDRERETDWSGRVAYFHVYGTDGLIPNAAWFLPDPPAFYLPVKSLIAFFPQLIDGAWVGRQKIVTGNDVSHAGWAIQHENSVNPT
jgi:uncharacterized protein (DUF427 family)